MRLDDNEAHLVYSESEDLWPRDGKIHFLGSWCLRYDREHIWGNRNFRLSENIWENRQKFQADYGLIRDIYEKILVQLSKKLNEIHGTQHDVRFWRIVVGWWLFRFIQITFHRWHVLELAASEYEKPRMIVRSYEKILPAANDSHHFGFSNEPVSWNERIFADLAHFLPNIRLTKIKEAPLSRAVELDAESVVASEAYAPPQKTGKHRNRRQRCAKVYLSDDFLEPLIRARLEILLGQCPERLKARPLKVRLPARSDHREWHIAADDESPYLKVLGELIPLYIPVSFVEGFRAWTVFSEEIFSGINPEVIMTANAHYADDAWKLFAAEKTSAGARLVIQQHGGFYGVGLFSSSQDYEISISDRFLSWGWKDAVEPTVYPAPAGRLMGLRNGPARKKTTHLLLVQTGAAHLPAGLYSAPFGLLCELYFEDQFRFLEGLSDETREALLVRDYPVEDVWGFKIRALTKGLDLQFDSKEEKFVSTLMRSRLAIFTNNSTTFMQSFVSDVPTLMFWDPQYSELSDRAQRHFVALQEAKVFFPDARACAEHVNEIWGNEKEWWQSGEVQKAVKDFCQEFAYVGRKPIRELKAALTQW